MVALVACGTDPIVIAPVIDTPLIGHPARPFGVIDSIELAVAVDGEEANLVSRTFTPGEPLELPDVPYGENLVIHMTGRIGLEVFAYGRTCKFSVRPDEPPPSPHLYFSRQVFWSTTDTPLDAVRIGGWALTHRDGSAIFVGGHNGDAVPIRNIDRFDATAGAFVDVTPIAGREGGAVAPLGDGRVVIAGGLDPSSGLAAANIEIVAVDQKRVEPVAAGPLVTSETPALATLTDGRVVAFGGVDAAGTPLAQIVDINGKNGGIELRVLQSAQLAIPRHGHTATRVSDDLGAPVLIAGGVDDTGAAIKTAELFKPLVDKMATTFVAEMIHERRDHRAVRLIDGSILFVGGRTAAGAPVPELEVFSFETGFRAVGVLPPDAAVTDHALTPLPDGRILIAGGLDINGNPVAGAFIADLDTDNGLVDVVTTDPLSIPRVGPQATALCDGTILLVGGTRDPSPAERYNPPPTGRR